MIRASALLCVGLAAGLLGGGLPAAAQPSPAQQALSAVATAVKRPIPQGDTYWDAGEGIRLVRRDGRKYKAVWWYEGAVCEIGTIRGKRVKVLVYYDVAPSGWSDTATYRTWISGGKLRGAMKRVHPTRSEKAEIRAVLKDCLAHL